MFIFKELDTYNMGIFNNLNSYLYRNRLYYYDSLDSYLTNKAPKFTRKLLYYTNLLSALVFTIRYNKVRLLEDLHNYDQFTRLIEETNFVMSMVIGIIYIISPYLVTLTFDCWKTTSIKYIWSIDVT